MMVLVLLPALSGRSMAMTWDEEPQFHVEVGGTIDISAKVFRPADNKPLLLYISDAFPNPLLIDLQKKSVMELPGSAVTAEGEYAVTTKGVPSGKKVASYTLKSGASEFKYKGKSVSIKIRESLVGEVPESVILAHSPVYAALRDAYKPDGRYVKTIKNYKHSFDVVVMFATWCPTCKQVLPKFLKILDETGRKDVDVKFVGIAMGGSEPRDALEKYGHDYPAFIFFKDGKEIDRIIGEPAHSLERSIADLLTRSK